MTKSKSSSPFENKQVKVVIVDDHSVVREGYKRNIEKTPHFTVCGEAGDGLTALEIIKRSKPDIAILDLGLKGMNGIDLIKNLKNQSPKLLILVVSMFDETVYAERALRAGAQGYIMKEESVDLIMAALERILAGKIYLSDKLSDILLNQSLHRKKNSSGHAIGSLSDRELEVFRLFGKGLKMGRIAQDLHLSVKTVESYRSQIKQKLHIQTTADLDQFAIEWTKSQDFN